MFWNARTCITIFSYYFYYTLKELYTIRYSLFYHCQPFLITHIHWKIVGHNLTQLYQFIDFEDLHICILILKVYINYKTLSCWLDNRGRCCWSCCCGWTLLLEICIYFSTSHPIVVYVVELISIYGYLDYYRLPMWIVCRCPQYTQQISKISGAVLVKSSRVDSYQLNICTLHGHNYFAVQAVSYFPTEI